MHQGNQIDRMGPVKARYQRQGRIAGRRQERHKGWMLAGMVVILGDGLLTAVVSEKSPGKCRMIRG